MNILCKYRFEHVAQKKEKLSSEKMRISWNSILMKLLELTFLNFHNLYWQYILWQDLFTHLKVCFLSANSCPVGIYRLSISSSVHLQCAKWKYSLLGWLRKSWVWKSCSWGRNNKFLPWSQLKIILNINEVKLVNFAHVTFRVYVIFRLIPLTHTKYCLWKKYNTGCVPIETLP